MKLITAYATQNPCYSSPKIITPKGIVVHSTGANNPYLKRYVDAPAAVGKNAYGNHWNNANMTVCVHSFIGYDIDKQVSVANILPYNYRCWGVGGGTRGSFNNSHIQFEICEDGLTDAHYFKKIWAVAVEYCVYLCQKFNLDPLGANVIVGHYEAHALGYGSNHGDPRHWFTKHGKTMDDFRNEVAAAMGVTVKASEKTETAGAEAYSLKQFIKDIQGATGAAVDGIAGKETLSKTPTLSAKINRTHAAVKYVQKRLYALGYVEVGKADGIAGAKFTSAVAHFQLDNGCVTDGEITARNTTWKKLLGMS